MSRNRLLAVFQDRIEPAQHGHGEDDVAVLAPDVEVAEDVVGDAPDVVRNPVEAAVARLHAHPLVDGRIDRPGPARPVSSETPHRPRVPGPGREHNRCATVAPAPARRRERTGGRRVSDLAPVRTPPVDSERDRLGFGVYGVPHPGTGFQPGNHGINRRASCVLHPWKDRGNPHVGGDCIQSPSPHITGCRPGRCVRRSAALVGEQGARGLSANVVSRLKRSWDQEYQQCAVGAIPESDGPCGRRAAPPRRRRQGARAA